MGSVLGSAMKETMDDNMKKSQEFMLATQQLQMKRQIQMQNKMRERMMAMQLAGAKEMFNWLATFYGLSTVAMFAGFARSKNPAALAPFLPLTFIVGYQADYVYGNKVDRIRADAEKIMKDQGEILQMPAGVPTFEEIEAARKAGN